MKVYLDNAATTPMDERVFEEMCPYLKDNFGNPSSIHSHGREARASIEIARKKVADLLNASPAEIFFTSGGTEADNTVLRNAVSSNGIFHVITSRIEHHAVLHTLEFLERTNIIDLHFVDLDSKGHVRYDDLERLLGRYDNALVSLMHANNEIGNITDIQRVGDLCKEHNAFFHSDTVQSMGMLDLDFSSINIDAVAGSAHKFHGPKGIGIMYINGSRQIAPLMYGGAQERNMRGGTENVAGIIGLAKALEIACSNRARISEALSDLKKYSLDKLKTLIPDIFFNGDCENPDNSLHKIVSLGIPGIEDNDMLLFNLDIQGISVSGGSACSSGTNIGSHVLEALDVDKNAGTIRISFSKYTTKEHIDYFAEKLNDIVKNA